MTEKPMEDNSSSHVRRKLLEKELGRYLPLLQQHYRPHKIILFGSLAAGKIGEWSDLDLVIVADTDKHFLDRVKEAMVLLRPQVGVDILVYTPAEFRQLSLDRPFFRTEILEKGNVLYERRE